MALGDGRGQRPSPPGRLGAQNLPHTKANELLERNDAGCYSLLGLAAGSPKQRPPVGSGDVRQFRDFGPWLVYLGWRYPAGALGLGGVLDVM